jgi:type IV pilus assembly protein PilF
LAVLAAGCPRAAVDENKSATRLDLAKDFLAKRDLDQAEIEARRALGYNPRNEVAHLVLGLVDFLRAAGNFRLLEQEDCLTGLDAEVLRAEMDTQLGRADGHFARAVEASPDYGEAWSKRGLVAFHLEDYEAAVRYLERAFDTRERLDNVGLARADLAWVLYHQGKMPEAATALRQALQFQPGMCVAKYRLGRVYFAREEWNNALEQFRGVVDDPECRLQEANLYLVKTMIELGTTQDLSAMRDQCVELAPRSCMARQCRLARPASSTDRSESR